MAKEKLNWKLIILAVVFVFGAFAAHWGAKAIEGLTNSKDLSSATGMLVFTMEGCGYCTDLKNNVLNKLAPQTLAKNIIVVEKGSSDADKLISDWKVQGFPTIYFLQNGQKMLPPGSGANGEYEGPRDLGTIQTLLTTVLQGYTS